jgi:hypothetical protein
MTIWQILTGLAATPSVLVVARALARRMTSAWKARTDEIDYLRARLAVAAEDATLGRERLARCEVTCMQWRGRYEKMRDERDHALTSCRINNCPKECKT